MRNCTRVDLRSFLTNLLNGVRKPGSVVVTTAAFFAFLIIAQNGTAQTTFSTPSNSAYTYTVPAGCTSLLVSLNGAAGGVRATPGYGARVTCTLAVTAGLSMNVYVGGQGAANRTAGLGICRGGQGGSATLGTTGGGGGGSSEIRIGGTGLANRVLVAGGGGGGSANAGGDGGYPTGGNGGTPGTGTGGTQTAGGGSGSQLGSQTAGGVAVNGSIFGNGGGGGGGGYWGGGGGPNAGGGGGGSSYIGGLGAYVVSGATVTPGLISGNGSVVITPIFPCSGTPSAGTAVVAPTSGSQYATFTLSLTGSTSAIGITYQWQKSANGSTGWTDIAGATTMPYSFTGQTATTYYRCKVICNGSANATSPNCVATFVNNGIPPDDGGFESGPDMASNNWNVVAGGTNQWYVGNVPGVFAGARCGYISNNGGTSWGYDNGGSVTSHIYRDVTLPTGVTTINLSFRRKVNGESSNWDQLLVYYAPTSVTPAAGTPSGTTTTLAGANLLLATTPQGTGPAWVAESFDLPASLAGTTFRLIFTWKNDGSGGSNPPAAVDNISVSYVVPCVPPAVITGTQTVCPLGTSVLSSATAGGAWSSGNAAIASVSGSGSSCTVTGVTAGTADISYTVSGCSRVATVTVNPKPSAFTVSPSSSTICNTGPAVLLTAGSSTVPGEGTIGTLQNQNTNTGFPSVFSRYYGGQRTQMLVLASELTAMGFGNGSVLNSMNFKVVSLASAYTVNSLMIRIAPTTLSALTTFITTGLVTVRPAANYTPSVGDNLMTFSTTYAWNGTDNLVFDVTSSNNDVGTTTLAAIQYNTTTSFNSCMVYRTDNVTPATAASATTTGSSGGLGTYRPDFDIYGTKPVLPVWSNVAGLYTNAGATAAYASTASSTVYALPATNTTYTATATSGGCTTSSSASVTIGATVSTPITGTLSACATGTSTLANSTIGGGWVSSATGVAVISAGGVVTAGGAPGTTTISYTLAGFCPATAVFVVNANPGAITGTTTLCTGTTTTLSNSGGVGNWTSSNVAVATVGATTGVVAGISAGTSTIFYANGCGTPASIVISVNQTPGIAGAAISCIGVNTALSAIGTGGTWSSGTPAVGSINAVSGLFTPLISGVTTINYTLGNGCVTASRVQTVNTIPSAFTVTPSSSSICSTGPAVLLTAGSSTLPVTATVGTLQNESTSTGFPSVFSRYYGGQRTQMLVLASELAAMGYSNGSELTGMNFKVVSLASAYTVNSLMIRIAPTSLSALTTFITAGLVTVRPAANYTPSVGDNVMNYSTTYTWNGTDNLVFDVTSSNNDFGTSTVSAIQYYTNTSFNSCMVYRTDNVTPATAASATTTGSSGGLGNYRPDFDLFGTKLLVPTWSNVSGLYTNAGATVNYTGTERNTVYALPAASATYTATATDGGCSRNSVATVSITNIAVQNVTGSAGYCAGGSGVAISLSGSQTGVTYTLKNGASTVDTKAGTGSGITFANQTAAATYTVVGTTSSPSCSANMSGSAIVSINALPTAVTGSGSGTFCGASTSISGSNGSSGTIYFQGNTSNGTSTVLGGTPQTVTASGTYYFRAQSAAGCWGTQASVPVTLNPLPAAVAASGAGSYFVSTTITADNGGDGTIYFQGTTSGGTSTADPATSKVVTVSGTYYFRAQSAAGCWGPEGSVTVTITAMPATVVVTGAGTFCGSTTITADNGGDGTIYFQGTTSGGTSTATASTSEAITASGTYYFRAFGGGIWGAEGSAVVVINAVPASVTASGGGTFCGATSISGSNGSDGSIFYQGTTSGGTSTVLGGSPQSVATSGTYYFRAQSAAGCWGNEGSVTVTTSAVPTAAPSNDGPICVGGTVNLAANGANGAATYSWSGPDGYNSILATPTATPTVNGTYSLTVTNGTANPGCSPTTVYTTDVVVKSTPSAAPSNDGPICIGGTVNLAANGASGATNFSWTGPNSFVSGSATPTLSPTVTGTYTLVVSDGSGDAGCSPTTEYTTTVTVKATPTAAPSNNGYICDGGTVTLTANPGANTSVFNWTGASLSSGSATNPTATPSADATYTLTVSDGSGNSGCAPTTEYTTSVLVHSTPTAAPGNDGPICNGGTVNLTANPGGSTTTYAWTGTSVASATSENTTATPTATTVYSLQVTDGSTQPGCTPSTVYVTTVSVNATPAAAPTNSGPICVGGTVTLTAHPSGGASTFVWNGPGGFNSTSENPTDMPTATGVYSLTVTNGTGDAGCAPTMVYTTSVTVKPTPTAAPSNNGYICNGGTVTLTANPGLNTSVFSWTGSNLTGASNENPTATPVADAVYTLTVSDGSGNSGCAPTTEYTSSVLVHAKPAAAPSNSGSICIGGTVTLTANPTGGASTFSWSGASIAVATDENTTATPVATQLYSLTVTDGSTQPGCAPSTIYTTNVVVKPTPVAAPTNNGYICIGGTVALTANPSGGANTFVWAGPGSFASGAENPTGTPTVTGIYSLTVSDGTADNGCAPTTMYTTTVSVNATPVAAPTNSGVICNGGTSVLTSNPADGANTYIWSGSALASTTAQNPTATPTTGTHIYTLQVSDGSTQPGCAPATIYTTSVTVNNAPTLTSATNDGQICEGITLNLSANGAADVTGYSWAGPVAITNPLTATPSVPGSTTAATGIYTVTVNNASGSGCTATYTTAATVNLVPTVASITPSTVDICVNVPLTFSAGAVTGAGAISSYNWSGPNGFLTTTPGGSVTMSPASPLASGSYSLSVTYPGTGCTSPKVSSSNVVVNFQPTLVSVGVLPGELCAGTVLSLTANGAAWSGAGSIVSYNWTGPNSYSSTTAGSVQTYTVPNSLASGNYSVTVSYSGTGCTSNMVGSSAVTVNPLPTVYTVNGGGFYCEFGSGVNIGLDNSDPGITYQLYLGASASGAARPGTGAAISFGDVLAEGTYSVLATDNITSCAIAMDGTTDVNVGAVPVQYTVTGGGGYCLGGVGVPIGLSSSTNSVVYQLYRDGIAVGGLVPGDAGGAAITMGTYSTTGTYTIWANPSATCKRMMNGNAVVFINPLPNVYTVSGGGTYCSDGAGLHITQDYSVVGINYQLYNGSSTVGSAVLGANSSLDFGLQTAAGTYTVRATNSTTGCVRNMTGAPTITVNTAPDIFDVTGGGTYCSGGSGEHIDLSNSVSGINYQVYNGSTATGSPVAGIDGPLSLGTFTAAGTYSVRATNATNGCFRNMNGTATIVVNPLPVSYVMNGGGTLCAGTTGVHVGLNHGELGINYQLYNGSTPVGGLTTGAYTGVDFGFVNVAGIYTVAASNSVTGCTNNMTGSVTVVVNPNPVIHSVTGGGGVCDDGGTIAIGIDGSDLGTTYQLYLGSVPTGSPVAANGLAISMGNYNAIGTYSVLGTITATGCTKGMLGTATISLNATPASFNVTGGGHYCAGSTGQNIGLSGSEVGINYQLYNGASSASAVIAGDGNPLAFGVYTTAGTYTVIATNATTLCSRIMTGSAVVVMDALPTAFAVTGGGTYCNGGAGVNIGLANSVSGINYTLYRGSTAVGSSVSGSGTSIDFGLQTAPGTYSVSATNATTGCMKGMTGTVNVMVNPVPPIHTVTGGGYYCAGGAGSAIGLDGSNAGINYQLYRGATPVGSTVAGNDGVISFPAQAIAASYSVMAVDAGSSCTSSMAGSVTVSINAIPSSFAVTGGGSYCAGGPGLAVGLFSSQNNVNYRLYRDGVAVGSVVAGDGTAISFGLQAAAGTYSVGATDVLTGCVAPMTGNVTVVVNPLPVAYNMSGGGSYCAGGTGLHVGMEFTASGVNYQLLLGGAPVGSAFAGANSSLDFGLQTAGGLYTVRAQNAGTGCQNLMATSATIVVNALPVAQSVSGGGSYCAGGSGLPVGLSGSENGITYRLYRGTTATGLPVTGSGPAVSFGSQTTAGVYTVMGTNTTTGCVNGMSGSATIVVNPLPNVQNVTGGGTLCSGNAGYSIGLDGSQSGISYQLYKEATATGTAVIGSGSAFNFGVFTAAGIYTVHATNTGTGCNTGMTGGALVVVNPLPTAQTVTGGGSYCSGGNGVTVGVLSTETGVNYTLRRGATTISTVAGTGAAITYGLQTTAGTYTVVATNTTTGCVNNMTGSAVVIVNPLPVANNVTGGGSLCAGNAGVNVGLSGSQTSVNYQLYKGTSTYGGTVSGTGGALNFGAMDIAGVYTVRATNTTTGCVNNMSGSATVIVNSLPTVFNVSGGGSYCAGNGGLPVTISGSENGINYQLYNGSTASGTAIAGTGSALSFGSIVPAGTYTVRATNATTGCTKAMAGAPVVTILPLPPVHTMTGGGAYCIGGAGVNIGLSGSDAIASYQVYNNGVAVGTAFEGNGTTLDFGLQTAVGTYSVLATNIFTGCTSAMSGTSTIGTNALPVAQNMTGGGGYCNGGTGVAVGMSSTEAGVNYQLYRDGVSVGAPVAGTGSALGFGMQNIAGNYSVVATNSTTGCVNNMTGFVSVFIQPLPTIYTVGGGGSYCNGGAGVPVTLSGSNVGVNYQLYKGSVASGSAVAGTSTGIGFGSLTAAGTYSVRATNSTTGCTSNMLGTALVIVNSLPTVQTVTGGGQYCAGGSGVEIGLASSQVGVSYKLYNGATMVSSATGTGIGITFGAQLAATTYTVAAVNTSTGCTNNMSGSATITINSLPVVQNVTGGGSYCAGGAGLHIGMTGSENGVAYQLYRGATMVGAAVTGDGSGVDFGAMTIAGTYSATATNTATGCMSNMTGTADISINALPATYAVTGGGGYCSGGTGVAVGLSNSQSGVSYQLYNGTTMSGTAVAGTGSAITFGMKTAAGNYTAVAVNTTTSCTSNMTGSASVNINTLPAAFIVTGGGTYCAGGNGFSVGLSGSNTGVTYQLYNGASMIGTAMSGTGSAISFGVYTMAGTYSVLATNTTSCTKAMTGSATINVNSLPVTYAVTGGGAYCAGSAGVSVGLSGSNTGVNYQLYNGTSTVGFAVAGTGGVIDFGVKTAAGTYSVAASNPLTGCGAAMTGAKTIVINALPLAQTVSGGGSYCAGENGVFVSLVSSQTGVNYRLYNGATAVGSVVAGTGTGVSFGLQTGAGTYTVMATNAANTCTKAMNGASTVNINALPTTYAVTGGGSYCADGNGLAVGLSGSDNGVNYQLYNGTAAVGAPMAGTGSALNFGLKTAGGSYTISAVNATTSCAAQMGGSATIIVNTVPTVFEVNGGGNYCVGAAGVHVGLEGSSTGINYQLYNGTAAAGAAMAGTGGSLDFGIKTAAGNYTVKGVDQASGCSANMSGATAITVNTLPTVYTVTGGGSYCAGGTGVNVGLSNSATGINYQLFNGASASGTVAGNGGAVSFGMKTAAGSYTVVASNSLTGCSANMTGSATVVVNALPQSYAVAGGGSYCAGSTGLEIALDGSNTGINYRLYNGSIAQGSSMSGTGTAISFGTFTTAGTYSVMATNSTTGCTAGMTGTKSVIINALPVVQTMTGGGNYCAGGTGVNVGLASSEMGISYQLYNGTAPVGAVMAGTGNVLNFGMQTAAGVYTVMGQNAATLCTSNMSGNATVVVTALPTTYNMTGGGSYCAGGEGVAIGTDGSQTGISYQLYNGSTATGTALAGTGMALDFGMKTAAGDYSVRATNTTFGCKNNMNAISTIAINALPATHAVTGGGSYCAGGAGLIVGLDGSDLDVNYTLYQSGDAVGAVVAGTGGVISFGAQTTAGNYTVMAANALTGCSNAMTGSKAIIVNQLPVVNTVTASGSSYCAGGTGINVSLSGSEEGVSYQLYNGTAAAGTPVAGTGSAISFGLKTAAGSYNAIGTNTVTGCMSNMTGSPAISINPLPTSYNVTGGGATCAGSEGVAVTLAGSEAGVTYTLKSGGATIGTAIAGTGSAISFGMQTTGGTYTVIAGNAVTGCARTMSGNAVISINPLPTAYNVTGGGSYCNGGAGLHTRLSGSSVGITYQLYRDGAAVGSAVAGTGAAIDFGVFTAAGVYTVKGNNSVTACSGSMNGSATIIVNELPEVFDVVGGGSYCQGGAGLPVGVSGSADGINYRLYRGTTAIGVAVAGNGSAISFGSFTTAGVYSVAASNTATGCAVAMTGSKTIVVNALPELHSISGGGNYCADGTGANIGIAVSESGVQYQLYMGGTMMGSAVTGTGGAISFGPQMAEGTYTVLATNASACVRAMPGTANVAITPNSNPTVSVAKSTDLAVCSGTSVTFTATATDGGTAPTYQWHVNGVNVGAGAAAYSYVPGNGDEVSVTMTSNAACPLPAVVTASTTMAVNATQTPVVIIAPDHSGTICKGLSVTFTATSEFGGDAPVYAWMKNGVFKGAGLTYTVTPEDNDDIYCTMTSNFECRSVSVVNSDHTIMDVMEPKLPTIVVTTDADINTIKPGDFITFTVAVTDAGDFPEFQWSINGSQISGATTLTFVTNLLNDKDSISCRVLTSGPCGGSYYEKGMTLNLSNVGVVNVGGAEMDLRVVPNPNNGKFTISGTLGAVGATEARIEITNMLGQVVYSGNARARGGNLDEKVVLDNALSNGMYLITVTSGDARKVFHISVSR